LHTTRIPGWSRAAVVRVLFTLALGVLGFASLPAGAQEVLGSGSTFAFPVVAKWVDAYAAISGVQVRYHPIGSPAGVMEITAGVVDFGLTDAPLADSQLLRDGLAQFPVLIGAIVPVVNLDGIATGQLHLTGELLADIYLGKITKWNDPAIAALNPELSLPNRSILVVYRSDGSGTTYNWTDYLAKVSVEWRARAGVNTSVAWPVGVSGKGNGGVAANVARVKGAIGYVEYSYALGANLVYAAVRDQAGEFVSPDTAGLQAATAGVDWARQQDFFVLLSDSPAAGAYPIVATTFALIRKHPKDPTRAHATLAFFHWAVESGQDLAGSMHYLPLPAPLVHEIESYWEEQTH
jgi:phosphate transport system substrate-binding protein